MFKEGHHYRFTMWGPGKDGLEIHEYEPSEIVSVELPLLKIRGELTVSIPTIVTGVPRAGRDDRVEDAPKRVGPAAHGETIINTASIAFVSAKEED
jgi:hypothetical protein